jgi:hypothetical protein
MKALFTMKMRPRTVTQAQAHLLTTRRTVTQAQMTR